MRHANPPLGTSLRQQTRRHRVAPVGSVGLALAAVHLRKRRRVHHDVGRFRAEPVEELLDGLRIGDVELGQIHSRDDTTARIRPRRC